jgi:deoxyinosine 3'endonuclease (endonuclease V)
MFVPPQVLENLAKVGVAEARLSIQQSKLSRKKRAEKEIDMKAFIGAKTKAKSKRKVYDCKNKWEQRVKLVRDEGKPATAPAMFAITLAKCSSAIRLTTRVWT